MSNNDSRDVGANAGTNATPLRQRRTISLRDLTNAPGTPLAIQAVRTEATSTTTAPPTAAMLLEDLNALGWDPDGPADAIDDGAQLDANVEATLPANAPQLLEKLPHVEDLIADYVRFAPDAYADIWRHLGPLLHAIAKHARAHQALHLPLPHQSAHAPPPLAPKRAHSTINCHGDEWTDDFRWLHDRTNPEVLDYIAHENDYTRDCLERPTAALRTQLVREFIDRIDENERTAEVALPDGWTYYSRKVAGHEYRQHVRYRAAADGGGGDVEEEVYLDENELAAMPEYADGAYFRVGFLRHSPCGRFIAFGIDGAGNERFTIYFKDLHRHVLLPDRLHDCWENFEFSHDGKWGFYLALDSTERAFQVRRHRLGDTDASAHDQVLYQEDDDMYFLTLTKTCNSRFVLVHAGAQITSETWALDLDEVDTTTVWVPVDDENDEGSQGAITSDTEWVEKTVTAPGLAMPRRLFPRREGIQYTVEAHGDLLYVLTDEGVHKNNWLFRVPMSTVFADAEAPIASTESVDEETTTSMVEAHREIVIPPRDFVLIEDFQVRQNHLVVFERSNCIQNVRVIDLRDASLQTFHYVSFSETVYSLWPMSLDEEISDLSKHVLFATNVVRYTYTSFLQPKQIVDYHMDERTFTVVHTETVAGAAGPYNPDLYAAHRLFAIGEDGTAVPMSVVYRKDLLGRPLPGSRVPTTATSDNEMGPWTNPTLVHAYGAYGSCVTPIFSTQRLSLLDRGFVYAIAHVRGGADLGMAWYDEGKLAKKPNTIKDFVRCLHHLIKEGYTTPAQLAIYGRSAGGLLMGAVLNEAPDLIQACLMEVPFVDVVNTMFDASLPWTAFEYTEWGNPAADRTIYDVMRGYCPYTNVQSRETYPHVMVCGGMNDPRVSFFEPVKFVAKLRHCWQSDNLLLLRIDDAGHGGNSGQYAHLDDLAQEYAFLIYALGAPLMPVPPPVVPRGDITPVISRPGSVVRSASFAGGRASPTPAVTLESVSPRRSRTLSHRRHEQTNVGLDVPRGGVVRRARSPDPAAAVAAEIDAREYKSKTARGDRGVSRVYQWVANFF